MEKRIAIITGAAGCIGSEFVKLMLLEGLDEIWAIDKNEERLAELKTVYGDKLVTMALDLTDFAELRTIGVLLQDTKPLVAYLINCAGLARFGSYDTFHAEEIQKTIAVNCTAMAVMSSMCIPYMKEGCRIVNLVSASSFQPLPYLNLYASSKAFARNYSRALNWELKRAKGITVTAVCPGWADTDMLPKVENGKEVKLPSVLTPEMVAVQSLKAAKKGKDLTVFPFLFKFEHLLAKVLTQKASMNVWFGIIKKYVSEAG